MEFYRKQPVNESKPWEQWGAREYSFYFQRVMIQWEQALSMFQQVWSMFGKKFSIDGWIKQELERQFNLTQHGQSR